MNKNDHSPDEPIVELPDPTADFPRLGAGVMRTILRNEFVSIEMLSWPSVSNWNEGQWRKAIERKKVPAYKFPNGRVLIKSQDVVDLVMSYANPTAI